MNKNIIVVFVCFLCLGFIFFNSSQSGETSNSRSNIIVDKVVTVIAENNLSKEINKAELNLIIRKCAHGLEFALLAIMGSLCLNSFYIIKRDVIIYTLFIVLSAAVLDEFFQSYIPGRNSNVIDVLIDFSGGIMGCIFYNLPKYKKIFIGKKIQ